MVSFISYPADRPGSAASSPAIGVFGTVCYAFVALLLRLVVARDFFLSGQSEAVGPTVPLAFDGYSYTLVLPAQVSDATLHAFAAPFATGLVTPAAVAYFVLYAQFLLPICLVIGFGTRVAALLLLIVTVLFQLYVAPEALWTVHVYWIAMLLVLMTCGGGALSLERLIRWLYQK
jgi:putative oxidoreductase